ncbi:MAG: CYTH domain-containing protein [Candidatus Nanohaloarchaea archaeon]
MDEIELKILEIDKEDVERRLYEIGASKIFESEIHTELYRFENKDTIDDEGLLRLRVRDDEAFVTRKMASENPDSDLKIKEEIEFDVDNPDEVRNFFKSISLNKTLENNKKRVKWVKDDVEVVLDKHEDIPWFLEIEADSKEKIEEMVEQLGYKMDRTVALGALELLDRYNELE